MFLSIRTLAPIALSLALVSLTSCQSASKEGKKTFSHTIDSTDIKHVEVATVSVQTLPDLQEYTSTVEAKVTNQIAPQMASRIKRIYVEVGQQVSRGQLLAEMDHSQLEQARLQLTRTPRPLPTMTLRDRGQPLFDFVYDDFTLTDYNPYPHIPAPVSV